MTLALGIALVIGLAAGLLGAALMLARSAPVDLPDERRLHSRPTPRGGGIGIPIASLFAVVLLVARGERDLCSAVVLVAVWALPNGLLGFIDDHRPLRSRVKFMIQIAAAALAVGLGLRIDVLDLPPLPPIALGLAAYPFTTLWLVWMANVFNFMDGIDALAAGSGALFFAAFAIFAGTSAAPALALVAVATGAALLGFLHYNRPPARIFMGDAGALHAGALLGGLAVALAPRVPLGASLLVLAPFLWDATFTIVRRLLRGDPMLPHRTHLFQRLVLAGWSQGRVRLVYFVFALASGALALVYAALARPAQAALLGAALAAGGTIVWLTRRAEARGS